MRELVCDLPQVMTLEAEQVILVVLTLIDMTLAANLLLIVLFSGYGNLVSKLDIAADADRRPGWGLWTSVRRRWR